MCDRKAGARDLSGAGELARRKLIEVTLPLPKINDPSAYDKMPGTGTHTEGEPPLVGAATRRPAVLAVWGGGCRL